MTRIAAFLLFLLASAVPLQADRLKMAVTTSFENSGLADILLPAIRRDTGLEIALLTVGTGQALRLGAAGDVDAILVHAKSAELAFVEGGYAPHRREIMYNDFIILGPKKDPAAVTRATSVVDAMRRIKSASALFVSRGDDSGTHKAELALWDAAGINIGAQTSWYREVGSGMGATLNTTSGLNAYTLADRATWLNFGNADDLTVVFEGDPALFNQYAFLPISADLHSHVDAAMVNRLENWLASPAAQHLIDGYRVQGQRVFTFNATQP